MAKKHYVLERGSHPPLPLILDVPDRDVSLSEALHLVFEIADRACHHLCRETATKEVSISCGAGCASCCNQIIPSSDHEALHLLDVLATLPNDHRKRVRERFDLGLTKLEKAGLLRGMVDFLTTRVHEMKEYRAVQQLYHEQNIPCPFLEDGACSVYEHRPVACRQYLVTTPPALCGQVFSPGVSVDEVHHPVDIGGALAGFDGENARATLLAPILFAPLLEDRLRAAPRPRLPAGQMIGRFIDYAGMFYVDKE